MASVTAFVIVGTPHPNDISIAPEFILELWEGSRATWVIRRLSDGKTAARKYPLSPDQIGRCLVDTLASMMSPEPSRRQKAVNMSVIVVPLEGSSMIDHLHLLGDLKDCDVHVQESTYSRVFSSWSGEWGTRGRIDSAPNQRTVSQ